MKTLLSLLIFVVFGFSFANTISDSQKKYINSWSSVARAHMTKFKIPASITIAQAILESNSGESDLAKVGNNHFGIKCSNWTGETFHKNDDKTNECFRKYKSAAESFEDHAKFLSEKERYSKLFILKITDYKGWAKGLKACGYATHPKYAEKIIDLIELHNLQILDSETAENLPIESEIVFETTDKSPNNSKSEAKKTKEEIFKEKSITIFKSTKTGKAKPSKTVLNKNARKYMIHANKVKFIVVKKGDTYFRIAQEFKMGLWQLYKYNDFGDKKDVLEEGDIVYLQPKRRKSKIKTHRNLVIQTQTTLRSISQKEAIKLDALQKMNSSIESPDVVLKKGTVIELR